MSTSPYTQQDNHDFSCIYSGYVSHSRHQISKISDASNKFQYSVMYFYLDLEYIEDENKDNNFKNIPFFSVNKSNIISWHRKLYVGDGDGSLSKYIKDLVYLHCKQRPNGKVCLLTLPTQFGFYFNPVSTFYCFDKTNTMIQAIVLEVHNTPWMETHCYILPFFDQNDDKNNNNKLFTACWDKAFHVSPFYKMNYKYIWSFSNPNNKKSSFKSFGSLLKQKHDDIDIKNHNIKKHKWGTSSLSDIDYTNITNNNQLIKVFDFGFKEMNRIEINLVNMIKFALYFPVICCVIQLWIHWQAAKVYFKGISIKDHPQNKGVNPFKWWFKHIIIFFVAIISKILSIIPTLLYCNK